MRLITKFLVGIVFLSLSLSTSAFALEFNFPDAHNSVVGNLEKTRVGWGDTFHTIGREFDIGYDNMACANPDFRSNALPLFYHVLVPARFILPKAKRQGIVINLAEKRLFYYDNDTNEILTFPVGIGRLNWGTPLGKFHIIEKIKNPTWYAPKSILKELAKKGYKNVPAQIPPGPQDPLGDFALRLSSPLYLLHGTNDPASIGTQASSGCIRLFPKDIASLFKNITVGTKVTIVDQPFLLGYNNNTLYLVVFGPLMNQSPVALQQVQRAILKLSHHSNLNINWRTVAYIVLNHSGIPTEIGKVKNT